MPLPHWRVLPVLLSFLVPDWRVLAVVELDRQARPVLLLHRRLHNKTKPLATLPSPLSRPRLPRLAAFRLLTRGAWPPTIPRWMRQFLERIPCALGTVRYILEAIYNI